MMSPFLSLIVGVSCEWANLAEVNQEGVDEAIDLDDYALFFLMP